MDWTIRWRNGKPADPRIFAIGGLIATLAGMGFLVAALVAGISTDRFVREAIHATGRVTALVEGHDTQNNSVTYTPVFSFTTASGQVQSITSQISSNPAPYAVGDAVTVLYRADNASGARLDSFWQLWFWSVFLAIFGSVFGTIGTAFLLVARLAAKQKAQTASAA